VAVKENFKRKVIKDYTGSSGVLSFASTLDLKKSFYNSILDNRRVLKALFFKKWIKSNRLSKFISKLSNQTHRNRFYFLNLQLALVAKQSGFIFSENDLTWLVRNNLVHRNGLILKNSKYVLQSCDFIEFTFLKSYLQYLNKNRKFVSKNSYLMKKRLGRNKRVGLRQLSKVIMLFKERGGEVLPIVRFIELDFQSFSFFILPQFSNIMTYSYFFKNRLPLYSFPLLN
jgi:hypothetical protein